MLSFANSLDSIQYINALAVSAQGCLSISVLAVSGFERYLEEANGVG